MQEQLKQNYVRIQPEIAEEQQVIAFDSNKSESLISMGKLACTNIFLNEAKIKKISETLL